MSAGQHGERAHCHYCNANMVPVEPPRDPVLRARGLVVYALHAIKGGTVTCPRSPGMVVPDQYRHQGES